MFISLIMGVVACLPQGARTSPETDPGTTADTGEPWVVATFV